MDIVHYRRGSGPTILFVMGLGGRATDWNDAFLDRLADAFEVVTFDNRGTGASYHPDGEWTLDVMADEAVGVLDALGRRRAHVVGLSMGGMIAQLVALRHPDRVERLALLATHMGGFSVVPPAPPAIAMLMADRSRPPDEIVREAMTTICAPGFAVRDPGAIEELITLALAQPTPPATFVRHMGAIMATDRSGRLADIRAPTLVVHGDQDSLIPVDNGRALAAGIAGARLVELPETGHMPMWERPERLATLLREFLTA